MFSENMLWSKHIVENERNCRSDFLRAIQAGEYTETLLKLDKYLILVDKFANFTSLIAQLNESKEDIGQFTALISGGYYKASLLILRSHFEIYVNMAKAIKSNQPVDKYEKQRNSRSRHFNINGLTQQEGNLEKELHAIYEELSKNAHSTGRSHGNVSYNKTLPVPSYDAQVMQQCFQLLERAIDAATGVYLLCTTNTMKKQDMLVSIFGKDIFNGVDPVEDGAVTWLRDNIRNQDILV